MAKESTKTSDMTTGSPVRLILIFAIPRFIGNIFQQIYNVADTMIAGYNLGDSAIDPNEYEAFYYTQLTKRT